MIIKSELGSSNVIFRKKKFCASVYMFTNLCVHKHLEARGRSWAYSPIVSPRELPIPVSSVQNYSCVITSGILQGH